MKTQKPMRALLAAFMLLVGISSTNAALCSASTFAVASLPTCDCPLGTGPAGGLDSALPPKTGGYGAATGTAATAAQQLAAANLALILCTDLLPGYSMAASTVTPTVCVQTGSPGSYCPGITATFASATKIVVTVGTDSAGFGTPVLANAYTIVAGQTGASGSGTAIANHNKLPCVAGSTSIGATGLLTTEKCLVTNGKRIASVTTTTLLRVTGACPAGSTCPAGCTLADDATTCGATSCIGGGNADLKLGGFICPLNTYGTLGTTIAASVTSLTGEVSCGAGSAPDDNADLCEPQPGFYGATNVLGLAMTACPTGISSVITSAWASLANKASLSTVCTALAPGYYIPNDIPRQIHPGTLDALAAGILPCSANMHCPGEIAQFAIKGTSQSAATYAAVAKSTGTNAGIKCPAGIGNALTVSAQGANAVSEVTGCIDLLPGYSFAALAAGTAVLTLITKCSDSALNNYGCDGSAGLFVDYTAATKSIVAGTGLSVTNNAALTTQLVLSSGALTTSMTVAAAGAGSLVLTPCPTGSTNTVDGGPIADCLLKPGYFVDESNLLVPAVCPLGEYCLGGGPIGTAGGALTCPNGSVGRATSAVINSAIGDCTVSKGFYIAGSNLNTPVPCPTATACGGGGAVGIAGGSVACPTGSTNEQCIAASSSTTTVNLTPTSQPITNTIAAPAAPDVTVSNTVPSASSAASTVASMVVVTVAALVAL